MDYKRNYKMDHKNRERTVKISEINKILQKYRNSILTYDTIRKIVCDMNESILPMEMGIETGRIMGIKTGRMEIGNNDIRANRTIYK